MKTTYEGRRTALRARSPMVAGALSLLLIAFTAAGQQAPPPPKATAQAKTAAQAKTVNLQTTGAQSKTSDGPKPAAQSPYTGAMMQVPRVVVPDVRGRTPGAAQEILQSAGLKFGATRQSNGPGTPGTIWQQSPVQKSVVFQGTTVNVEIVATPQPPRTDQGDKEFSRAVPSLIGRTPAQAQMILFHSGLTLGNQAAGPGSGVEGTIYAQNPQPGQWVHLPAKVDVQIVQANQPEKQGKRPEPPQVIVPQLRGLNPQQAQQVLAKSRLQIGSAYTGQVSAPAGAIYDQRPQAGTRVYAGSSVDLLVAAQLAKKPAPKSPEKAPEKIVLVPVPDVRHRDANTAAAILQHSRLNLGQQTREESESNPGLIASQLPPPGTQVQEGSTVDIVIAVAIPPITVPNVVKLDEGRAATDLSESRLRMGSVTQRDSDEVSGTVLAQNPVAGARVPRDSSVNLTVSRQIQRTLRIMVDDPNPEAEKSVRFHAHLDREATGFQYRFIFGDGKQSRWTSQSIVAHAYETPGAYVVTAAAARGAVKVPSASVEVTAKEIAFHPTLSATPQRAKPGETVTFTVKNDRADIGPLYRFEFADGKQTDWSNEPFAQHSYEHSGTYVTKVRARVGSGRIVESVAQVEVPRPLPIPAIVLIVAGLTGVGIGAFVYHGWQEFLKCVRAVPRMDVGEQNLVMQNRESSSENARLRMVWPRGEQLVEWAQGQGPRKAESHD